MQLLRDLNIDQRNIRCIENLYWYQTAQIRLNNELSDDIEIRRGVRQGCVLSPLLFNLYSERVFREALEDLENRY